jgi:hypothetical protein
MIAGTSGIGRSRHFSRHQIPGALILRAENSRGFHLCPFHAGFRVMASFENAHKFFRVDNDLLPTFRRDLKFRSAQPVSTSVA